MMPGAGANQNPVSSSYGGQPPSFAKGLGRGHYGIYVIDDAELVFAPDTAPPGEGMAG